MRKALALTLVMTLLLGIAPFALAFEVIPTGHWAANAVQTLNSEGVLIGYPDGTFKGDQAATRFELALALKRLETVVQGLSVSGQAQNADLAELNAQLAKLREDVDKLGESNSELAGQSEDADRAFARRDQFMNDLADRVLALETAVQQPKQIDGLDRLDGLDRRLDGLTDTTKNLSDAQKALQLDSAAQAEQIRQLQDNIAALQKSLDKAFALIAAIQVPTESQVRGWMQPDFASLKGQLDQLSAQSKAQNERLDKLTEENSALRAESEKQKSTIQRLYWALGLGIAGALVIK